MTVRELITTLGFKVDESGAKRYEEVFNRVKKLAITAAAAIGLTELTKSVFEVTSAWEEQNMQLGYIIGNAEKAHDLMLELNDLAKRSPFKTDELAGYARTLINFGFSVNEITPLMSRLANIAAVLGKDSIPGIVESLARMKQRGYADARVMMELFHAGIPIQEELAKKFGVTNFQMNRLIQEGRVGFKDVNDALTALTTGTGSWAGAAAKEADSLKGQWKAVQGIIDDLKISLGNTLMPVVKDLVGRFKDWLDVNKGHLADDMIKLLNTIAYTLGWIIGRVKELLITLGLIDNPADKEKVTLGASSASSGVQVTKKQIMAHPLETSAYSIYRSSLALNQAQTAAANARAPAAVDNSVTIHNITVPPGSSKEQADFIKRTAEKVFAEENTKRIRQAAPSFAEVVR